MHGGPMVQWRKWNEAAKLGRLDLKVEVGVPGIGWVIGVGTERDSQKHRI